MLQRDFKLMCDNCMTYNHPDTIFYKEARRLLSSGLKITTKVNKAVLSCQPVSSLPSVALDTCIHLFVVTCLVLL